MAIVFRSEDHYDTVGFRRGRADSTRADPENGVHARKGANDERAPEAFRRFLAAFLPATQDIDA